ncbi:preprotein translocase subunit YajC [Catenulispora sp. GP43]|uniref:preprotein translocase subunit YajC n=1 Tax=Catenulispora sp. GP43 TaxID=3156263 RepID=UPI003514563C
MGSPVFLIWIVLIGAMFYFMMIRPQKRARAQQSDMLQHLQPGAQVRTTAQIMGTIVEVGDDWAIVETTPGTRIKFGKPAIVGIIMDDEAETEAEAGTEDGADAPTPGGIGDAPHGVQDAVPAQDSAPADAEPAVKAEDASAGQTASADASEEVKDAEPAKS